MKIKQITLLFILAWLLAPLSSAQEIKLQAQTISASRSKEQHWETSWGSYDKTIYRDRIVQTTLSSNTASTVTIECYWLGTPIDGANRPHLTTKEQKTITLKPGSREIVEFGQLWVANLVKYTALGINDNSGHKYYGWVIRIVSDDGKTLATQGARPPMVDLVARLSKQ